MKQPNNNQNLLCGIKPVLEMLKTDPQKIDTLYLKKGMNNKESNAILEFCRKNGIRFSLVDQLTLNRLANVQHQGVIARIQQIAFIDLPILLQNALNSPRPLLIALDQVQDPSNVGTLARTVYALGFAGLILPKHNSAYLGEGAKKAAAGALDYVALAQVTNLGHALDSAEEAGFTIIGTGMGPNSLNAFTQELPFPSVLVLGNEGKGMRPTITKRCGCTVSIPMHNNFNSLNVAQAGAIILGLAARQCSLK